MMKMLFKYKPASNTKTNDFGKLFQMGSGSKYSAIERASQRRCVFNRAQSVIAGVIEGNGARFEKALENVAQAVLVLDMMYPRAFEGEIPSSEIATGFIVDKTKGIILTNRHVVTQGPIRCTATFLNKEQIQVEPIWADPVHDFGFLRFDPGAVRYSELVEVPLSPERAKVGKEIRVVGNDAGEELQILSGTLARLDRHAPAYNGLYFDFNTFYFSAASSTSGGSSGSPVVDDEGHAVALNAGGSVQAASSFFLPLDRPARALGYIQKEQIPPRGTIQAIFEHRTFTEVERMAFPDELLRNVRSRLPLATGLLMVETCVPEGPADKAGLKISDVLYKLNGELVHNFLPLANVMDSEKEVCLELYRGAKKILVTIPVDDLNALVPQEFLEVSNGIVHAVSYHRAVRTMIPIGLPVVVSPGYMFRESNLCQGSVLCAVGDVPTPTLSALAAELCKYEAPTIVPVTIINSANRFVKRAVSLKIERTWFSWRIVKKVMDSKFNSKWIYKDCPAPVVPFKPIERTIQFRSTLDAQLVTVDFTTPFPIDGSKSTAFTGVGFVVDAKLGLVVCDRLTAPSALGNITVTVGGSFQICAKCVFVHPEHSFSVLQMDLNAVSLEAHANVYQLEVKPSEVALHEGDPALYVGISTQNNIFSQLTHVTTIERFCPSLADPPQFVATQEMVINTDVLNPSLGGMLFDADDKVQAFNLMHFAGGNEVLLMIQASVVFDSVKELKAASKSDLLAEQPVQSLALTLTVQRIAEAVACNGLSSQWVEDLHALDPENNYVLCVRDVMAGSGSYNLLNSDDIILAVDGTPVTDFNLLERAIRGKKELSVTVLRQRKELKMKVPTTPLSSVGTSRVVLWGGAVLQAPHNAVPQRGFMPDSVTGGPGTGVYCSGINRGTPAEIYALSPMEFITGVNDELTPDLDSFLTAVKKYDDSEFIRLYMVGLRGIEHMITFKQDRYYFPTSVIEWDAKTGEWQRQVVDERTN